MSTTTSGGDDSGVTKSGVTSDGVTKSGVTSASVTNVTNDNNPGRGRSRRSMRQRKDQWQSQDTNLPGCKPRLGTVGRQLSEATYVIGS